MVILLETFFEAFYTFSKGTMITILHQESSVGGFEWVVDIFGVGIDHGGTFVSGSVL